MESLVGKTFLEAQKDLPPFICRLHRLMAVYKIKADKIYAQPYYYHTFENDLWQEIHGDLKDELAFTWSLLSFVDSTYRDILQTEETMLITQDYLEFVSLSCPLPHLLREIPGPLFLFEIKNRMERIMGSFQRWLIFLKRRKASSDDGNPKGKRVFSSYSSQKL